MSESVVYTVMAYATTNLRCGWKQAPKSGCMQPEKQYLNKQQLYEQHRNKQYPDNDQS